ncbi:MULTISPECIES: hypothetical protein [Vibrio]|uniref:hypothetical protein n=1 Tax=Vibrio TaxID=662 RepID=UPI0003130213|nr:MULTISPECIES: hypothetical protein [Vibrio]OCH53412.1 hypothetical protein A6E08_05155 [Vibrio lentus]
MSYDIVYEQLALRVPKENVLQQAYTFFRERLNHTDTQSTNELKQALYGHYRLRLREDDLFMLHMLIGSSNLFDTETNKRARSWQFCGVNTSSQLLVKYGCDWSAAAESGDVKLNGRDTKAEGWIRALRNTLNHAKDYGVMPYCHTLEVWLKAPLDTSKQTQLDELKTQLSDLDATWKEQQRFDDDGFDVSIKPKSAFEMWLFQQLINGYQGKCWINGSEPPYHAVKKHSI